MTNIKRGQVTMTNGAVISIEPRLRTTFWEKLANNSKLIKEGKKLSPCIGFEVLHTNHYYH